MRKMIDIDIKAARIVLTMTAFSNQEDKQYQDMDDEQIASILIQKLHSWGIREVKNP